MGQTVDLTNHRFGRFTVNYKTDKRDRGSIVWHCTCDCGNTVDVSSRNLKDGHTKSCGCLRKENQGVHFRDLTGMRFGKLLVISKTNQRSFGSVVWRCICDCGKECMVSNASLISGNTTSCGCVKEALDKNMQSAVIQKSLNHELRSSNSSGVNGVCYDKSTNKWLSTIGFNGKDYYLCRSKDKEYAIKMRLKVEQEILKPYVDHLELSDEVIKHKIKQIREDMKHEK
ncbi:hypothetical protein [Floccifex sp.]|uniref:hypothetical protein n=1 Tax=Floccifex sp. TaxID=2815810 RepID=UPI003F11D712